MGRQALSLEALRFAQEEETRAAATPAAAAHAAHRRTDDAAAAAPLAGERACAAGCAFCCYLKVEATPAEIDALAEAVDLAALRENIAANARRAAGLDPGAYRRAGIRCALLDEENRCRAYAARPLRCRAHTSTSRDACEDGDAVPTDAWLTRAADAVQRGLGGAPGELHAALLRRLG